MLRAPCSMLHALQLRRSSQRKFRGSDTSLAPGGAEVRPVPRHSGKVYASLATWRGRTLSLSGDLGEGKLDRLPAARERIGSTESGMLSSRAVGSVTHVAKESTATIPIVMAFDNDPVGNGLVSHLRDLAGTLRDCQPIIRRSAENNWNFKREIVPKLSRLAVLGTSSRPGHRTIVKRDELAAGAFGVKLQYLDVLGPKDIETAFRAATKGRADAVLVLVERRLPFSAKTNCRPCGKKPAPSDIRQTRICGRRGPHDLRREHYRLVPPRCYVCGQNFERR